MGLLSKGQDVELIKRILDNNDRKAADELVSRYYKCVYKHIYIKVKDEETGMDITQETFIAALRGLGSFNDAKASFKTWLTRILINHCYTILRQKRVYIGLDQCEESAKYDEYNIELKEAFRALDERYRLPIELFYGQGYKVKEIAALTDLPENTIKTYLSRGRKQLAKFYGEENSYDGRKNITGRN